MSGKTFLFSFILLHCCICQYWCAKVDDDNQELAKQDANTAWNCEILEACNDKLGFDAILTLHQRLDDDADGNIDIVESDEFLRDELNYESGYERQKIFHRNDKHISVDELWNAWKSSEVHNWTVEETIQWLISSVELPQYAKHFEENAVDGTSLPRMAVNNMHFLSNLGIKDPIHKHKISLKAMDVVLFGPPRMINEVYRTCKNMVYPIEITRVRFRQAQDHNYLKDIILTLSLGIAILGCWFAFVQHKKSQAQLRKTMKDMESLQYAEESLRQLQKELDKAKLEQELVVTEKKNLERRLQNEITFVKDSCGNSEADQTKIQRLEEELRIVTEDLRSAERALQAQKWFPSPALQHWLQLTHELELRHYNEKKAAAEKQLAAAKEGCEKLRKKRTSFMGAFRVAHGSSIDDVDNRILQAKAALSEVTKDLQERINRWKQIEALCGFSIVHNPGIRHLESLLGTSMTVVTPSNSVTPRMTRRSSEGTITDEESVPLLDSGISAIQHLVHNSATLFLAPLPSTHFSNIPSFHNCPSRGSPCQDCNFSVCQSGYLSFAGNEPSANNGSLANIPFVCSQRSGFNVNFGTMREIPPADLKTVASSSAILQRSNAFHFDLPSEPSLSEGRDTGSSFDDNSPEEGSYLVDNTRPVFTVGGSKEVITKGFKMSERDSDRFLQDIPKSTFLSNENDQPESFKSMKSASVPDNAKQFIGYSGNNYTFEECTEISKKYAESSSKIKKVKES